MPKIQTRPFAKSGSSIPRYMTFTYQMLQSDAYKSLSSEASKIFMAIRMRYNGTNNGFINFSCREGAIYVGVSKDTANRALNELCDKGFIKLEEERNFIERQARRWILTCERLGNKNATNDWKRYDKESNTVRPERQDCLFAATETPF